MPALADLFLNFPFGLSKDYSFFCSGLERGKPFRYMSLCVTRISFRFGGPFFCSGRNACFLNDPEKGFPYPSLILKVGDAWMVSSSDFVGRGCFFSGSFLDSFAFRFLVLFGFWLAPVISMGS